MSDVRPARPGRLASPRRLRALGWAGALALLAAGALAASPPGPQPDRSLPMASTAEGAGSAPADPPSAARRLRVGLVLSGGGARGFAHIGVLRVLEQLRVPVDVVVGTSMGSVVGGAYAAGRTAAELERFAVGTDWAGVLADRPPRRDGDFRVRESEYEQPSRLEFGLGARGRLVGPPAAVGSHALERALEQLIPPGLAQRPAGSLRVAFRAVSTDLRTGELVELDQAPLAVALRASLSVPGLFAPLTHQGRLLVDGGLVRNVPVDLARALGAEVLIVVNVGTPVDHVRELGSALGVAQQMINLLTEQNAQRSLAELGPADVLIQPELAGLDAADLATGAPQAIAAGEAAARAAAGRLAALARPEPAWRAFEDARVAQAMERTDAPARLQVQPTARQSAEVLAAAAGARVGQLVDEAQARQAADRLYATGEFERVEVRSSLLPDGRAAVLVPVPAPWRTNPLRLGLETQIEQGSREDATRFTATALATFNALNAWGAQARLLLRLGSSTTVMGEWWQPLGAGSPFFAVGSWRRDAESRDVFFDGQRFNRVGVTAATLRLGAGLSLGRVGDLQLGLEQARGRVKPFFVDEVLTGSIAFSDEQYFVQLRIDTLDSMSFPTQGQLLQALWQMPRFGAKERGSESEFRGLTGFRLGSWAGHVYGEASRSEQSYAPLSLGGFLRLSGTPIDSIDGQSSIFGRLVVGRPIGQMPIGLGGAVRAGFSLEAGTVSPPGSRSRLGDARKAGSVFVSIETRVGPVYLALGATRHGEHAVYVFLGPFW
ncbi:MAG: patatin-like phospholipase family protein [Betaproteobacteria bacterium]|jgi:NTE family protein|nr:patatin-like phospholipase family protein [Rubrivivax sp.]